MLQTYHRVFEGQRQRQPLFIATNSYIPKKAEKKNMSGLSMF